MIGHEGIGVYCATCFKGIISQPVQVQLVIFISEETGLTIVAALDNVKGNIGQDESGSSWHNR